MTLRVVAVSVLVGAMAALGYRSTSSGCDDVDWSELCLIPIDDTQKLIIASIDLNPTISQTETLHGTVLSDFCEMIEPLFHECKAWNETHTPLYDQCLDKSTQSLTWSKTSIVDDIEHLCFDHIPSFHNVGDWATWAESVVKAFIEKSMPNNDDIKTWAMEKMELFDVDIQDGELSAKEACLLTGGQDSIDWELQTEIIHGTISTVFDNDTIPQWAYGQIGKLASLSALKCNF